MSRPFFRDRRLEEVNAAYDAYLQQGFPTADFPDQPEPETLQCRDELDRTNWLGLIVECQVAIATDPQNAPGANIPDPGLRCTSNRMYVVTYAEAMSRMFSLLGMVQQAQANWWRLKDLVRSAATSEELNAIDLTEGWP